MRLFATPQVPLYQPLFDIPIAWTSTSQGATSVSQTFADILRFSMQAAAASGEADSTSQQQQRPRRPRLRQGRTPVAAKGDVHGDEVTNEERAQLNQQAVAEAFRCVIAWAGATLHALNCIHSLLAFHHLT